jgi:hypothetical protein
MEGSFSVMPLSERMWNVVSGVSVFGRYSMGYFWVVESTSWFVERKRDARA